MDYFDVLQKELEKCYKKAQEARRKGIDPEDTVEIPLAKNMAERVEGLISAVAPQIVGCGISKRITQLEKKYGALDWRISLIIAEEIALGKYCKFKDKMEAIEIGIRVGFAYHTMGTVSSPIEGFVNLKVRKTQDGKEYLAMMFSGPIRSAGGTGASVSVLIADYMRKKFGYEKYDPTDDEINRMAIELYDYHERITNLQYLPSVEEIKFLVERLPIQIDGDPSEKIEVSNYKDLPRIETNNIRNGVCLVLGEGIAQKSPKLWKQLSKWGKDFDLDHWNFLEDFIKLQKEIKSGSKKTEKEEGGDKISPDYTFIKDLVAGRPILTHPMATGGFRLRYGRSRTSGYSSYSIHPSTMIALDKYIAIGTQLKLERPGKGATVSSCDSIEGPIVVLNDGSVVRMDDVNVAKQHAKEIKKILFLGDMLVNYGDFFNRAHMLIPPGYCEEWWVQELEKGIVDMFGSLDFDKVEEIAEIPKSAVESIVKNPFKGNVNVDTCLTLARKIEIPLHPKYTYHWKSINFDELNDLMEAMLKLNVKEEEGKIMKSILLLDEKPKTILEKLGVPHIVVNNEFIVFDKDDTKAILAQLGLDNGISGEEIIKIIDENKSSNVLELVNKISGLKIRDKSGYFIGARMGRPEKAKMRQLTGSPHVLFPVGEEGGRLRSFNTALEAGKINGEFPVFYCSKCERETIYSRCEDCGQKTKKRYFCHSCGVIDNDKCSVHGEVNSFKQKEIDIKHFIEKARKEMDIRDFPDLIKGVRGTSNKDHTPEPLQKGILRAIHGVYVNKDGTTRYDMTQMPITHFKPKEVRTSIEKLHELGYTTDIHGKPLENGDQVLELQVQDIILPGNDGSTDAGADVAFLKVAKFIDDMLVRLYKIEPYYNAKNADDLVGCLGLVLAPHTSAATLVRFIGFSKTQGLLAHPMMHAATRRDCLSYDSYVEVKINGLWHVEKIGKIVEDLKPSQRFDDHGTIGKTTEGIASLSGSDEVAIKNATIHKPRPMKRIFLEDGRSIKSTFDHKLLLKNGKWKKAENIKAGDQLQVSFRVDIKPSPVSELNLLDIFHKRKDIMIRHVRQFLGGLEKISYHENYVQRDSFPIVYVRQLLDKHGKTFRDLPSHARIAIKRDNVEIPIKIPFGKDLLEIVGLYIAGGFIRKNENDKGFYQVSIAATNSEVREQINKVFFRYFNLKPSENHDDHLTFSSRILFDIFEKVFKLGHSARTKRISPLFLNLDKENLGHVLRGYYEGDGSVSLTDIRVTCDSVSEGLKNDLSFALARFGIYTKHFEYEKDPGPIVKEFYIRKKRKIPKFKITKTVIPSSFVCKFKSIGFISSRKRSILQNLLQRNPYGTKIEYDDKYAYPKVVNTYTEMNEKSYCFGVDRKHSFNANRVLVHNCDGDEASVSLLLDMLINFSRKYLPSHRGSTQDVCLVATSKLIPAEIDDMVFDVDIVWKYPLEFYNACLEYKMPWDVEIKQISNVLNTDGQYSGMGFTHPTGDLNNGVRCSAYKTIPAMEDKLKGQMVLADKIMAVDEKDVARRVIEKHFLKDIKGNLRKFSMQQFRCVVCNEKFRRPPIMGKCTKCGGKIIFTISEGSVIKYLEPSISLASKYELPSYLSQTLELLQKRVDAVFGKEKEKQEGLGKWFG